MLRRRVSSSRVKLPLWANTCLSISNIYTGTTSCVTVGSGQGSP